MFREIKFGKNLKWIDAVDLNQSEIKKLLESYEFHELDIEASLEGNQKARIDIYDDYSFLVFHFPKYNTIRQIYELNEFNIFLGKDFLITFRDYHGTNVDSIFDYYSDKVNLHGEEEFKVSTGYILYQIIEKMLEKMFKVIRLNNRDIRIIENNVFDDEGDNLVKEIMKKKRNIMIIKNIFKPQVSVFRQLEGLMNKMYEGEIEEYFEDLEDKLDQILSEIALLEEYINSVEDAFKTMIDIKTNSVMKFLTIFSAFMLPLTLITSFYGMNVDNLPFVHEELKVYAVLATNVILMLAIYYWLKKKGYM